MIIRTEHGTLFSLRAQGSDVTTKTSDKNQMANESKIMNTTIISTEAKARLTEAVKNYTPPAPEKYRALNEVKESIMALRERKASYETIRAMLHENAGVDVSHQTIARYCRELLDSAKPTSCAVPRHHWRNHRQPPKRNWPRVHLSASFTADANRASRLQKIFSAAAQSSPVTAATGCDHRETRPCSKTKVVKFRRPRPTRAPQPR